MLKECGSISRVAEVMYTSQPAISIAIKELETELGYPLLRRTNRGILFTERGELVLEQARIITQAVERINHISACSNGELQGVLRAGALPHLCNTLLLSVQNELQEAYPDFTLQLEGMETPVLVKMLERESIDLILVQECDFDQDVFHQKLTRLRFEPLFEDEMSFVTAAGHPLLERQPVTLTEVMEYPFTIFGDGFNRFVMTLTQDTGYPSTVRRFYETVRMRRYMDHSHAVTVLPKRAVIHGNMNYHIKFQPLQLEGLDWRTRVGWMHSKQPLTQAEQIVVEHLTQQISNPEFSQMAPV
ncbi:MAG: LysR family transcriptional regulator [Oscillospiraceae bacterium]|nr:LysR family transcriptional regulator [Oscillospiraceae bacterium]